MKTRTWFLDGFNFKTARYNRILIELSPRKRSVWLDISVPRRYFLQFPWTYITLYCTTLPTHYVKPDKQAPLKQLEKPQLGYNCGGITACSTAKPLESWTDLIYFIPGLNGSICGGNTSYYHEHYLDLHLLLTQGLEFYWNSAFYTPGDYLLRWQ
jgi:hypothetical protein